MNKLEIEKLILRVNGIESNLKSINPVMEKISIDMKSQTKLNFRKQQTPEGAGWKKSNSGQTLRKTSALMHSIASGYGENFAMVGTNKIYARIHQEGGIIKPKNGRYLTIPLSAGARGKSAKEFDGLFSLRLDTGLYLVKNKGKNEIEFMYQLVKSVTIPKRPYMGVNKKMLDRYKKWLGEFTLGG